METSQNYIVRSPSQKRGKKENTKMPQPRNNFWQENIDIQAKTETWKWMELLPGKRQARPTGAGGQGHHRVPSIIQVGGLRVQCGPGRRFPGHKHREGRARLMVKGPVSLRPPNLGRYPGENRLHKIPCRSIASAAYRESRGQGLPWSETSQGYLTPLAHQRVSCSHGRRG